LGFSYRNPIKTLGSSEWIEYQAWLFHHSFLTLNEWQQLRNQVMTWQEPLFFSLVTPVYNTDPLWLKECADSVRTQIYPYWQWCLVDDGSSCEETRAYLAAISAY
jgi:O-antigen biosynthesis protein